MDYVEELLEKIVDHDTIARGNAAERLSKVKDIRIVPALIEILKQGDDYAREGSSRALRYIKDVRTVPALIEALRDKHISVRSNAAMALGYIGQLALPALIEALKDNDPGVRYKAIDALEIIKDVQAVPALFEALKDSDPQVRQNAVRALAVIKDIRAVPALIEALNDDSELKWQVIGVLREILKICDTVDKVVEFDAHIKEGLTAAMKHSRKEEKSRIKMYFSELKMAAAKKKNELAQDKGIILTEIPKPPNRGTIYRAMERVRNG